MNSNSKPTNAQDYAALEKRFLNLCGDVTRRAAGIYGQAGTGNAVQAAEMAISLSDHVADMKQAYLMEQEQRAPDSYDLAGLRVDAGQPSNSETGFEDRG